MASGEPRRENGGQQQGRAQDEKAAYETWLARHERANVEAAQERQRDESQRGETWRGETARGEEKQRAQESRAGAEPFDPSRVGSSREPSRWVMRHVEQWAERLGKKHLLRLAQKKGRLAQSLDDVPDRMRKVAQQTQLALELLDDFKAGEFRDVPWHSVAILSGAVLYLVSPLDVIPDKVPGLGHLDEVALLSVAVRLAQKDLRRYCEFKGRPAANYF